MDIWLMVSMKLKKTTKKDSIMDLSRKLPIGIQSFQQMREEGFVYVDKTDLMWNMVQRYRAVFLGRPRRFGKTLLTTTMQCYFEGKKELFTGLAVEKLETEWRKRPVLRFDMSYIKGDIPSEMRTSIALLLKKYELKYGLTEVGTTLPGKRLMALIDTICHQTNEKVVVLIDEYDSPMLAAKHEDKEEVRNILREFYTPLKACFENLHFVYLTGITKFSQMSIFSELNHLMNISMMSDFSGITGFTKDELCKYFCEEIRDFAQKESLSIEELKLELRKHYDGYHFAKNLQGIYNPYSLLKSLETKEFDNYWFESGTPTFLIDEMKRLNTNITEFDYIEVPSSAFNVPVESVEDAIPLLYQSGYLTIKDYNREDDRYVLSIPNQEVRIGLTEELITNYTGLSHRQTEGKAYDLWKSMKGNNPQQFIQELRAYVKGIPYVEGFKKKLAEVDNKEGFYEWTFYLIFSMLNSRIRTQVKTIDGRIDALAEFNDAVWVIELKLNGTPQEALEQINSKDYAIPYTAGNRTIYKIGLSFSTNPDNGYLVEGEYEIEGNN